MSLGSSHITITTAANFIPTVWSREVQRATETNLVAARLIKRFDRDVMNMGQVIDIPKISNMVANTKTASAQVTFQTTTEGVASLTVTTHKEASFIIEDIVDAQSAYMLQGEYKEKAAYALAKQLDTDILGLNTSLSASQTQGTSGQPPTDDNVRRCIQYLDDADSPFQDRAFIMKPSLKASLLGIDKYVNQDFTGMGDIPVKTGLFGQRYGLLFYVSTNVPNDASGNPINQIIHKEAYAAAVQKNITLKSDYIIEYLGQAYVAQILYGVGIYRSTFGATLLSN